MDGTAVDIGEYPDSYTFSTVERCVKFKEKPKYTITTKVENGAIDGSVTLHRDNSLTVNYTPYKHYELGEIVVDGEAVDTDTFGKSYTI